MADLVVIKMFRRSQRRLNFNNFSRESVSLSIDNLRQEVFLYSRHQAVVKIARNSRERVGFLGENVAERMGNALKNVDRGTVRRFSKSHELATFHAWVNFLSKNSRSLRPFFSPLNNAHWKFYRSPSLPPSLSFSQLDCEENRFIVPERGARSLSLRPVI